MMIILFGPVCRVESVVVADGWLDTGVNQELADLSLAVLGGHVQCTETRLVLNRRVASILNEQFACVVQIFLNGLVKRGVLADFVIFLEIWVRSVLQQ